MKVIVAGSRTITSMAEVQQAIDDAHFKITELVHGCARGVDGLADLWAIQRQIPITVFVPDWDTYGKAAGPIRNRQMAEYADALIVVWDGKSKGTKSMLDEMRKLHKQVSIRRVVA